MWYYLNARNEILGPFPMKDIHSLYARGIITKETLVAKEGDDNWFPLAELLRPENNRPPVPQKRLGACPHCHTMLAGESVPAHCPCCSKPLHPGTNGLFGNAVYVFTQMFNFRGRATRREYWSYLLFLSLALITLQIITCLIMGIGPSLDFEESARLYKIITKPDIAMDLVLLGLFITIVPILMMFANLAATVRRLHDTGRSGYPLFLYYVVIALMIIFHSQSNGDNIPSSALALALIVIQLYILVCMLMPSKPGPNKYGPCQLFPHQR